MNASILLALGSLVALSLGQQSWDLPPTVPGDNPGCDGSGSVDLYTGRVDFSCDEDCPNGECGVLWVSTPYGPGTRCFCWGNPDVDECCQLVHVPGVGFSTTGDCNACRDTMGRTCVLEYNES